MPSATRRAKYEQRIFCLSRGLLQPSNVSSPAGPFTQFEAWYWLIEAAASPYGTVPVMNGHARDNIVIQPRPTIALDKIFLERLRMEDEVGLTACSGFCAILTTVIGYA